MTPKSPKRTPAKTCSNDEVSIDLVHPTKARAGDKVAVVSPSFAAPAVALAIHEQATRRLAQVTGRA